MAPRKVLIHVHGNLPSDTSPTVGNGLRARMLERALATRGVEVRLATHRSFHPEPDPLPGLLLFSTGDEFVRLARQVSPDLLVCIQGEGLEHLPEENFGIPVLADWIAPRLVEFAFQGLSLEKWLPWWVGAARKADYHACSTERQRSYLTFLLQLSGIPLEPDRTLLMPLGAEPLPGPRPPRAAEPVFVAGGVHWPWIRSERFLRLLLEELEAAGRGTLHLFGGNYPFATDADLYRPPAEGLIRSPRLVEQGLLPYPQLLEEYRRADVAVNLFEENAERRMAFSFREMDYLRAGLPLVCTGFSEIAPAVAESGAGWVLPDLSDEAVRGAFRAILAEFPFGAARSESARRLVAERFSAERTVDSLLALLENPTKASPGPPLLQSSLLWAETGRKSLESLGEKLRNLETALEAERKTAESWRTLAESKELLLTKASATEEELRRYAAKVEQDLAQALKLIAEKDEAIGYAKRETWQLQEESRNAREKERQLVEAAATETEIRRYLAKIEGDLAQAVKLMAEKDEAIGYAKRETWEQKELAGDLQNRLAQSNATIEQIRKRLPYRVYRLLFRKA